jgi:hypothetical protein
LTLPKCASGVIADIAPFNVSRPTTRPECLVRQIFHWNHSLWHDYLR